MTQGKEPNSILQEAEQWVQEFFKENVSAEYVYHDFEHTRAVVEAVDEICRGYDLEPRQVEALKLAAWFHDIGYDLGAEGHEQRSVEHALGFLRARNYPADAIDLVCRLILATRMPNQPKDLLEEIICDADMSHLGKKSYWDRCGRVRQELLLTQGNVMSEQEWVDFELDFMNRHRFFTQVAEELYNERKLRHIKQLRKQKIRLNPHEVESVEDLARTDKKKKKKKKAAPNNGAADLKEINLGRGVETMYRTTYRTHVNLSSIADNKANIMLSINAIIISIVLPQLVPNFDQNPKLILPTILLLATCLSAMVFATLSTRPKITEGRFSRKDIEEKRANLLFFGNFYKMKLEDFHWGMMEMIKDSDFLYSSMTRDLYYLGIVLAKKYRFLSICYALFMYGMIVSVVAFAAAFLFW